MISFWHNKPVLITGVSGFLGGHLAEKLIGYGANVIGTIHDKKKISYIQITGLEKQMTICQADILSLDRMREIISDYKISYIFHCAAKSIIHSAAKNPVGCFSVNVMGTVYLLEAARAVNSVQGIMCMESDKSYGSFDSTDLPYKEEHAINPKNVYEVSKACAGLISRAFGHNYGLPTYTIRSANLYGPGDMNLSRLFPQSILRVLRGNAPILYEGVADYVREFVYVEDAADAIVALMERIDETKSNIFNLGSGEKFRIEDVIKLLCQSLYTNLEPEIISKDIIFKEIQEQYLDLGKLKSFLPAFNPRPMQQGLPKTIEWYREYFNQGILS